MPPTVPSGWLSGNWVSPLNHSTHNPANVTFVNGYAILVNDRRRCDGLHGNASRGYRRRRRSDGHRRQGRRGGNGAQAAAELAGGTGLRDAAAPAARAG